MCCNKPHDRQRDRIIRSTAVSSSPIRNARFIVSMGEVTRKARAQKHILQPSHPCEMTEAMAISVATNEQVSKMPNKFDKQLTSLLLLDDSSLILNFEVSQAWHSLETGE